MCAKLLVLMEEAKKEEETKLSRRLSCTQPARLNTKMILKTFQKKLIILKDSPQLYPFSKAAEDCGEKYRRVTKKTTNLIPAKNLFIQ